jgi:hypothetical protein
MKTHIIQLELDDNVVSITDKLSWGKAPRVLLVFPSSGVIILREIDLLRVKRTAEHSGFSIGLVSKAWEVRRMAKEKGIPVFNSISDAQHQRWIIRDTIRKPFERKPRRNMRALALEARPDEAKWKSYAGIRLFFFSLGVFVILTMAVMFIPSANISLNIIDKTQTIMMRVSASEKFNNVNLIGNIPAYIIPMEVEGNQLVQVGSETKIPDKFASGILEITNLTDGVVVIPVGSIVSSTGNVGIRFNTRENREIPTGYGETINVPIQALIPGESGNVDANSLDYLIGDLGAKVLVNNVEPTHGGTDRYVKMATEEDRRELYSELEATLKLQAIQKAEALIEDGDIVFQDTVSINEISEEIYVPAAGQAGDQLSLHLKISYSIQYAKKSDLVELAKPILDAEVPDGYVPEDKSIEVETLEKPITISSDNTFFDIQFRQKIRKEIDLFYLSRLIQGVEIQEAYNRLDKIFGNESNPMIEITPSWWPRLPFVAMRIGISY